jgi:hypothetical protein
MKKMSVWRIIAKSLGDKSGKNNIESDKIALIRLLMFLSIFITNCFIIANAVRHWNYETKIKVFVQTSNIQDCKSLLLTTTNKNSKFE